ncbi:hypothetical protein BC834DRAFT_493503 [Gloeopeniophorella convolvens]|nr:hypothetical protein BC834DRAFT_493503 [Gloeopeniophorella convolvens]
MAVVSCSLLGLYQSTLPLFLKPAVSTHPTSRSRCPPSRTSHPHRFNPTFPRFRRSNTLFFLFLSPRLHPPLGSTHLYSHSSLQQY